MTISNSHASNANLAPPARPRVLYIGGYLDEVIVRERGLPTHNAAGSNRMARLGRALAAGGYRPVLLSPGTSLRARSAGPLLMPVRVHRSGPVPVVFARMLNLPGLNILVAPFVMLVSMCTLLRKGNVAAVIVYNFNPTFVLLTLYLRLFFGGVLLQNVEDVSEPRLADWLPGSSARPMQQLVFWVCMHLIARMVDGYVVPTRRFLAHLPYRERQALITGCIAVEAVSLRPEPPPLRVLFAGKFEPEHGSLAFLEALRLLDAEVPAGQIEINIVGPGSKSADLAGLRNIRGHSHGFVSAHAYRDLLTRAQVCVALQDPAGRYANLKTPSKFYEFLGYGKAVVATNVGDIAEIENDVLILLPQLSGAAVAAALRKLAEDPAATLALRQAAFSHSKRHFAYPAVGAVLRQLLSPKVRGDHVL